MQHTREIQDDVKRNCYRRHRNCKAAAQFVDSDTQHAHVFVFVLLFCACLFWAYTRSAGVRAIRTMRKCCTCWWVYFIIILLLFCCVQKYILCVLSGMAFFPGAWLAFFLFDALLVAASCNFGLLLFLLRDVLSERKGGIVVFCMLFCYLLFL